MPDQKCDECEEGLQGDEFVMFRKARLRESDRGLVFGTGSAQDEVDDAYFMHTECFFKYMMREEPELVAALCRAKCGLP